jgi:photosystem II stability/assembly factor-like uncharacterized protein
VAQWAGVDVKNVKGVVVGAKEDLRESTSDAVVPEAASLVAGQYKFDHVLTSAMESKGCDEPFMAIAKACVENFEETAKLYKDAS